MANEASPPELRHRHLFTLALDVDFAGLVRIGRTPAGMRQIAPVRGGSFAGERLGGTVLPGADWVVNRPDGALLIDVRLVLQTADGAAIYLAYQGRFLARPAAIERMAKGEALDPADYSLTVTAQLECGDERYAWLNDCLCVGTGVQTATGPVYEFFEIGADSPVR